MTHNLFGHDRTGSHTETGGGVSPRTCGENMMTSNVWFSAAHLFRLQALMGLELLLPSTSFNREHSDTKKAALLRCRVSRRRSAGSGQPVVRLQPLWQPWPRGTPRPTGRPFAGWRTAEADDGLTCGGTVEYEDVDTAKAAIDKYDGMDMGLGTTLTLEPQ